jgi:hypothetical protein
LVGEIPSRSDISGEISDYVCNFGLQQETSKTPAVNSEMFKNGELRFQNGVQGETVKGEFKPTGDNELLYLTEGTQENGKITNYDYTRWSRSKIRDKADLNDVDEFQDVQDFLKEKSSLTDSGVNQPFKHFRRDENNPAFNRHPIVAAVE